MLALSFALLGLVVGLALDVLIVHLAVPPDDGLNGDEEVPHTQTLAAESGSLVVTSVGAQWPRRLIVMSATSALFAIAAFRYGEPAYLALVSIYICVFVACGIGFGEEPKETELLKEITVEEPAIAGQAVTILLNYAQQYPVRVEVKCDLLSVNDLPTATTLAAATVSPLALRRTPEPTLPEIPRVRPTPKRKVLEILGTTLQPNEEGGPTGTATPELGTIERRFLAPEPGDYVVWCYTPVDQNNAIFQELTILPP